MRPCNVLSSLILLLLTFLFTSTNSEDPYRYLTWKITYGDIYPLGVKQQVLPLVHRFDFSEKWHVFNKCRRLFGLDFAGDLD